MEILQDVLVFDRVFENEQNRLQFVFVCLDGKVWQEQNLRKEILA